MKKQVVVFGGGITGLTVAHECAEAGMSVALYEKTARFGGKAVSFRLPSGAPVEHSLRVFQLTYYSLFDSMKRIPFPGGGNTFSRLVPLTGFLIGPGGGPDAGRIRDRVVDTSTTRSRLRKLHDLYASMREWGIPRWEFVAFLGLLLDYLSSSDQRRRQVIARQSFAEYAKFGRRSKAYCEYVTSLVEIAVAAKPYASAVIGMDLLSRLLAGSQSNFHQVTSMVNVTDGPTGEAMIDPWVAELQRLAVQTHVSLGVERIDAGAAILSDGSRIEADVFVLAIPHQAIRKVAPELEQTTGLALLRDEWSSGFQFFLSRVPESMKTNRVVNLVFGSPWRLVYLLEGPPIWSERASADVAAVLSITVSNVSLPGLLSGKRLCESTWEEVQEELLTQIGFTERDAIVGASFDPLLSYVTTEEYERGRETLYRDATDPGRTSDGHVWVSHAMLCIGTPESVQQPFPVKTAIDRLYMAGEFTDTISRTPNMEKASQAGKLCAQAIIEEFGLPYPAARTQPPPLSLGLLSRLRSRG